MSRKKGEKSKIYVLDTSVLIDNPELIQLLAEHDIVIPIWAIEELDRFKSESSQRGVNSRTVSRKLDEFRKLGLLHDGVPTGQGGRISIGYNGRDWSSLPVDLEHTNDNRMILVADGLKKKHPDKSVILLSKDTNLRLKANACGIQSENTRFDRSIENIDDLYSGQLRINLGTTAELNLDFVHQRRSVPLVMMLANSDLDRANLLPNMCCRVFIASGEKYALMVYDPWREVFVLIDKPKREREKPQGIVPINEEQAFAYYLLSNPEIKTVTLAGKAGSGKTLMALLAAYQQSGNGSENSPARVLVWRPMWQIGKDMGFLPGDVNEKFEPWSEPIWDCLRMVINGGEKPIKKDDRVQDPAIDIQAMGLVRVLPINFAQGSTKHDTFIIVDEAQNLPLQEVKILITRCGQNSKIVFTGDPKQVQNPYLDPVSNGLSCLVERFKGQRLFGHITLHKSERSDVAELAANLL